MSSTRSGERPAVGLGGHGGSARGFTLVAVTLALGATLSACRGGDANKTAGTTSPGATAGTAGSPAGAEASAGAAAAPGAVPAAAAEPGAATAPARPQKPGDIYFEAMGASFERLSIHEGPEAFATAYAAAPAKERNLVTAHWAVAEVSSGGFLQLFTGAGGVLAPEAVPGLRALGLEDNAAILEEAIATFGAAYPRALDRRARAVDGMKRTSKQANPFAELDQRFFNALKRRAGGFDAAAAAYARSAS